MGIDSISFERLLSHSPSGKGCLRDKVYDSYRAFYLTTSLRKDAENKANKATKAYFDELYKTFVMRQT
jgi:hypothetical protein